MFIVRAEDKPGHLQTRLDNRAAHLEYWTERADKLAIGGPMFADDGTTMIGSMLVANVTERAELDALLAADPYTKAGLFQTVTITPYKKVF